MPSSAPSAFSVSLRRWLAVSPRELAAMEDAVLSALRSVKAGGERDIVSSGQVKELRVDPDAGTLRFTLTAGDIMTRALCTDAIDAAKLPWLKTKPLVQLKAQATRATPRVASQEGLEGVRRIIAVSSCKGGVGKSTVAVNLAAALSKTCRVGILDTDVYGPSLPTMLVPPGEEWAVAQSKDRKVILPVPLHGMQCMSYGFVAPGTGGRGTGGSEPVPARSDEGAPAAVLRGPLVSSIVTKMVTQTNWGELDYLILDMPPGTGDISISLGQQIKIDGAVIVTTPQRLAFVDVVKGLDMFTKLKVNTLAIVENMAWFEGDDGKRYHPFGPGHRERLVGEFGIRNSFTLPISADTSEAGDGGTPLVLKHPTGPTAAIFDNLAACVREECESTTETTSKSETIVTVKHDSKSNELVVRILGPNSAEEKRLAPVELRRRLRRVDSMLGKRAEDLDDQVQPVSVSAMGSYAVSIVWSDGHDASIYPYEDILAVCEEVAASK